MSSLECRTSRRLAGPARFVALALFLQAAGRDGSAAKADMPVWYGDADDFAGGP
jgi:hypothetical protein